MNDVSFTEWMATVDSQVIAQLGVSVHDLPDYHWRDLYDDGLLAGEAWECFVEDHADELPDGLFD